MKTYSIRETRRGEFQVVAKYGPIHTAKPFRTRQEAEDWIKRTHEFEAAEQERIIRNAPAREILAEILARPDMREQRRDIQEAYGEACHQSKLARHAQRAAVRGFGNVSPLGRDIGEARQQTADYQADEATVAWEHYRKLRDAYQESVFSACDDAGIPRETYCSVG